MTNLWDWIKMFFRIIWRFLRGGYNHAIHYTIENEAIHSFILGGIATFVILFILLIIGFVFKLKVLVVTVSFVSAVLVFLLGRVLRLIVKAIGAGVAKIPVVNSVAEPVVKELKTAIKLFLPISMGLAFISAITAVRGVGYYSLNELMVWATLVLFTALVMVWADSKIRLSGWVMYGIWLCLFIGSYLFPIQVQGTLDWVESKTIRRAVVATNSNWKGQLIKVPASTPYYNESFGGFDYIDKTGEKVIARVIGRKNDPNSKEPMYKARFPKRGTDNNYVEGETYFVSASSVEPVEIQDSPAKARTAEYNLPGKVLTKNLQPWEIYTIDDVSEGQEWRYLSFTGSFSHRVDKGDGQACWKLVDNNQPWHAGWDGKLQVKAGNTPVTLTVNVL